MPKVLLSEHTMTGYMVLLAQGVPAASVLKKALRAQHQCTMKAVADVADYSSGFGGGQVGLGGEYRIGFADFQRLKEAGDKEA